MVGKCVQSNNSKTNVHKKTLPPQQRSIKQKADDLGLITTKTCNVKDFFHEKKRIIPSRQLW